MKFLPYVILLSLGIALGYFLFHTSTLPDHKGEAHAVDSAHKVWVLDSGRISRSNDSLANVGLKLKDTLSRTIHKLRSLESALSTSQDYASSLADIILSTTETPTKLSTCDSLASYVKAKDFQVQALTEITDSLVAQQIRLIAIKDDQIIRLDTAFRLASRNYDRALNAYDGLEKDYRKAKSGAKVGGTIAKVEGVIILVLTGIILTK